MRRRLVGVWWAVGAFAVSGLAVLGGCGAATVNTKSDTVAAPPSVTAVVAMPPRLTFGKPNDQRRAARRMGDALIQATGGHAILADELASIEPLEIAVGVRALGEDPMRTLTLSLVASRSDRMEATGTRAAGGRARPVHHFADFTARLEVRHAGSGEILGSVEGTATCYADTPEVDAEGHPVGLQRAVDEAIRQAIKRFAPNLTAGAPFPALVEAPVSIEGIVMGGALAAIVKLRDLQVLYPEVSLDALASLATSRARFLVVKPGRLATLGVAAGDLVTGLVGQNLGGRAALARSLAHGDTPAMAIDRRGEHFLIGQAVVAR